MKGADFKRFIFENKIKQSFLAEYIGVSEGFISSVVSGRKVLSDERLGKVLDNPFGWDTSMLTEKPQDSVMENPAHDSIVESLVGAMRTIETLINANATLADENRMLRAQLQAYESKGGTARSAEDSSSASAV